MIRLFYTKGEGCRFWPVDIKEDNQKKILAVCEDEENWIDPNMTALVGLECRKFSEELKRIIDTELLIFHALLFTDGSTWDSTLRKVLPSLIKNRFEGVEKYWKEYSEHGFSYKFVAGKDE